MIKPKLGQTLYCINREELIIEKEEVLAIGEDFIIPDGFGSYCEVWQMIDFRDCFTSLELAKKELKKEYLSRKDEKLILKETIKGQEWEYISKEDAHLYDWWWKTMVFNSRHS